MNIRSSTTSARVALIGYGLAASGYLVVATAPGSTLRVVSEPDPGPFALWERLGRATGLSGAPVLARVAWTIVAIVGITVAFLVVLRGAKRSWFRVRTLLGIAIAAHLIVAFVPLLYSADVFSYVMYGRVVTVHGVNPYEFAPSTFERDPAYQLVDPVWRETTPVYGPGFILVSIGVTEATGTPAASVVGFRILAVIASLATTMLVARTASVLRPDLAALGVAAFGLNPAVLFQTVASSHNDLLISLAIAVGAALLVSGRLLAAVGGLTLGLLVKLTGGPALLVAAAAAIGVSRRRAWLTVPAIAAGLILVIAQPFVQRVDPTLGQFHLSRHEGWIGNGHYVRLALEAVGAGEATKFVRIGIGLAIVFGVVVLAVYAYRHAGNIAEVLATMAWAMLLTLLFIPALLPWYPAWALPLAWVARGPARHLIVGLSVAGMMSLVVADPRLFPDPFYQFAHVANEVLAPAVTLVGVWAIVRLRRSLRLHEPLAEPAEAAVAAHDLGGTGTEAARRA